MVFFNYIATICFLLAVAHTFLVKPIRHLAGRFRKGSLIYFFIEILSEVELVFIIWSAVFLFVSFMFVERVLWIDYLKHLSFNEPLFVFCIMLICSTRFVLTIVDRILTQIAFAIKNWIGCSMGVSAYLSALIVGPLFGSLITEPAAMTVTAYFLLRHFFDKGISIRLKYATLGLLFANISIGGVLTPYAAPPVLMVARKWGWDLQFMISQFGWRSLVSVILSSVFTVILYKNELNKIEEDSFQEIHKGMQIHFREFVTSIKIREPLFVALFLAGLVILGEGQKWWVQPLIQKMSTGSLFLSSTLLTSVIDNAALTYLGSQVDGLSELSKYALVAGSVVGGGFTVIANAPNPVGYLILGRSFGVDGISPFRLILAALIPTLIALSLFGISWL